MGIGLMRVKIELAVLAALANAVIVVLTVVFFVVAFSTEQ
jgi:hypothetical protein